MTIVRVAIPSPLARTFDYRLSQSQPMPIPGVRVSVPFGNKQLVGIVVGTGKTSVIPGDKLKAIIEVLDRRSLLGDEVLNLLIWASRYYVYPIGEVMSAALPSVLRRGVAAEIPVEKRYRVITGVSIDKKKLRRAKLQSLIFESIEHASSSGLNGEQLASLSVGWRAAVKALIKKNLIEIHEQALLPVRNIPTASAPELHEEQIHALSEIKVSLGRFQPFLLNGITGSGKTEIYLRLIDHITTDEKQALLIVPEISLTPQLLDRFKQRLSCSFVTLHSGLNDGERAANWLAAAKGQADVVIGTRSAVFTPLPRLGLLIVDEEHDVSLKQQDGFRYHARDLSLVRARNAGVPIVLGSATPSLESLFNVRQGRYIQLKLTHRAGDALLPEIGLLDIRRRKLREGLSELLIEAIARHRLAGGQILIFINRRGFAPILLCADCGATADCQRCDAHMTVHARSRSLRCHHCGAERPVPRHCDSCGGFEFDTVGHGSERIEAALLDVFPDANVVRIDRDTTRRKGALESQLQAAVSGEANIMVGTQMLAKGHHFPGVTLVGILDADRGLFGTDFRALEQTGQLITQVAGRAGRARLPGEVLIQTRHPDHEQLRLLIDRGYNDFAASALRQRKLAELPPFAYAALFRAESLQSPAAREFLGYVARLIKAWLNKRLGEGTIEILGPVVAPIERIGGRYRFQLMVQSKQRHQLNRILSHARRVLETDKLARKVRWSIDVDPIDFF